MDLLLSQNFNTLLQFFIVGFALPFLVDLVTKKVASARVKSLTLLALSLIGSGVTVFFAAPDAFDWKAWVVGFLVTLGTAVVNLFGWMKPADVVGSDGLIAKVVPGGIGGATVTVPATEKVEVEEAPKNDPPVA